MKGKSIAMIIPISGILLGRVLNRILSSRFGVNGPLALILTIVTIFSLYILYLVIRRRFFASLLISVYTFPLLIIALGMYLDSLIIGLLGIISFFIVIPLFIKWFNGLAIIDKSYLWKHKGRW